MPSDNAQRVRLEAQMAAEIRTAGLIPQEIRIRSCPASDECFSIDIRQPSGRLWAQATHESVESIRMHIENWLRHGDR